MIRRAGERFVVDQPGIRTWHAFSAGAHYDPAHLSFGTVIGCDEHLVATGSGFDWHAHRGVVIVSWVLDGVLRHQDDGGGERLVPAGEVLVQSTGDGVRHRETNGSGTAPLRFVQTTLLTQLDRAVLQPPVPARVGDVVIDLMHGPARVGPGHVVVGSSGSSIEDVALEPGDTLRLDRPCDLGGTGDLLAVTFSDGRT